MFVSLNKLLNAVRQPATVFMGVIRYMLGNIGGKVTRSTVLDAEADNTNRIHELSFDHIDNDLLKRTSLS